MKTIIDRTATDGRHIRVTVYLRYGQPWVGGQIDEHPIDGRMGYGRLQQTRGDIIGWVESGKGKIGITAAEAAQIDAAMAVLSAEHAASIDGLLERRRSLLRDIRYARDEDAARRNERWSREDEAGGVRNDADGIVAAAEKTLADFDAAHPDVVKAWDEAAEAQRSAEIDSQINYRGE